MKFKNIVIVLNKCLSKFKKGVNYIKTTNHKDIVSDFYIMINKIINEFYKIYSKEVRYAVIVMYCVLLWIDGHITYLRLAVFVGILILIGIYKWLYINVWKLNAYININEIILLKIYKYKNPLILILIEIEIKIFYMVDYLKKKNVNLRLIKLIYNILYNMTGINGIKIVLYRFYKILWHWISNTMYELIFKRMFGMVLSILIFTNIIQVILEKLNEIYPSYIVWIYIFLVIISFIFHVCSIGTIEFNRVDVTLIWNILKKKDIESDSFVNKDIKVCLGLLGITNILNYDNFIIYLICGLNTYKWIEYNDRLLLDYCSLINKFIYNYIYIKKIELKKETINNDVLNYCEYQILLYKLKIFFFWDIENQLGLKDTLLNICGYTTDKQKIVSFDYNIFKLENLYNKQIKNIKLNEFFDLIQNKQFYRKYITYINDYNFQNELEEIKVHDNPLCTTLYYHIESIDYNNYITDFTLEEVNQQIDELNQVLNNWRMEWVKFNFNDKLDYKYNNIFNEINNIKNKYKCLKIS